MRLSRITPYYLLAILILLPTFSFALENTKEEKEIVEQDASVVHETADKKAPVASKTTLSKLSATSSDASSGGHFLKMIVGLLIVVICILFLAWLAKKMNRFQSLSDNSLKIIGSLGMGTKERVILLQVADQQLLVGVTASQINTLHVLDTHVDVDTTQVEDNQDKNFADKLKTMMASANMPPASQQGKQ